MYAKSKQNKGERATRLAGLLFFVLEVKMQTADAVQFVYELLCDFDIFFANNGIGIAIRAGDSLLAIALKQADGLVVEHIAVTNLGNGENALAGKAGTALILIAQDTGSVAEALIVGGAELVDGVGEFVGLAVELVAFAERGNLAFTDFLNHFNSAHNIHTLFLLSKKYSGNRGRTIVLHLFPL